MKIYIPILLVFTISIFFQLKNTQAQDYHFSQFDTAPLYTSPALTGFMEARNRFAIKYRNQWSSVLQDNSYKTILISYDGKLCLNENINIAYGANLVRDEVGFPSFKTNHYLGSIAAHIKLDNGLYVSGGLQGGLLQYQLELNGLNFENQFDGFVGFNGSLSSLENFLDNQPINLLDIGGGVLLYNKNQAWNLGVAFHHININNYYSFTQTGFQGDNRTKVRWIIHGSVPFEVSNKIIIEIKKMTVIQLPHWQTNFGIDGRLQISKYNDNPFLNGIIIGISGRFSNRSENVIVTDAILLSGKTDIGEGLLLGFGFDWNISPLTKSSNSRGGVEMSLVWEFSKNNKCIECPNISKGTYGKGLWQLR